MPSGSRRKILPFFLSGPFKCISLVLHFKNEVGDDLAGVFRLALHVGVGALEQGTDASYVTNCVIPVRFDNPPVHSNTVLSCVSVWSCRTWSGKNSARWNEIIIKKKKVSPANWKISYGIKKCPMWCQNTVKKKNDVIWIYIFFPFLQANDE